MLALNKLNHTLFWSQKSHSNFLIPLGQKKPFNRSASVGNHVLRGPKTTQEDGDKAANHGRKRNSSSEQQTPIGGDFLSNPSAALQRLFTCDRAMVADILQVCIFSRVA